MPTATAITHSVNSSREPVRAICHSSQGSTRRPPSSISATNAVTASSVCASVIHNSCVEPAPLPARPASPGSSTSTSTIARSSTTSQPTAMRPLAVSSTPRDSSARSSTTVLATDSETPNTSAAVSDQPHASARPAPIAVATAICTTAPGTAILRTASRSPTEKCRPTPNISSITPISASWLASDMSATKPGVCGPIRTPATR